MLLARIQLVFIKTPKSCSYALLQSIVPHCSIFTFFFFLHKYRIWQLSLWKFIFLLSAQCCQDLPNSSYFPLIYLLSYPKVMSSANWLIIFYNQSSKLFINMLNSTKPRTIFDLTRLTEHLFSLTTIVAYNCSALFLSNDSISPAHIWPSSVLGSLEDMLKVLSSQSTIMSTIFSWPGQLS